MRFPLTLAGILIAIQIGVAALLFASAGPDRVWLGDTIMYPGDQAVYLSYIEQIRSGANGLVNLYAPAPQTNFWFPFYVLVGLFARWTGMGAILAQEIARWLATLAAVPLIHAVSRRVTEEESRARWATFLVVAAGGLGWIFAVWSTATGNALDIVIPDVTSETFFFPILLAGAHIPLSFALLAFTLERLWRDVTDPRAAQRWQGPLAALALFLIHPYFLPLVGLFGLIARASGAISKSQQLNSNKRSLPPPLTPPPAGGEPILHPQSSILYALAAVVGALPHIHALLLNPSRRFLLTVNSLPLGPPITWLLAFAPWLLFLGIRFGRRASLPLTARERWLVAWILSAILALLLPFQWKRKLTEGLGAVAIWLAIPVFPRLKRFAAPLLLSPLLIIFSQIAWSDGRAGPNGFSLFASRETAQAWDWIRERTPPDTVVLADTLFVGVWTPPRTLRHVWVGQDHETPEWQSKRDLLARLLANENRAWEDIRRERIDAFLATSASSTAIFASRLGEPGARFGDVAVWYTPRP